jgi:hypothetical protein
MKTRHILHFSGLGLLLAGVLAGCSLLGSVSIDERIADFQADLNKTDRSSAYQNFHPDLTGDFNSLKSGAPITAIFPVPDGTGTPYALAVTDETNPSTGVFVTVTGGPTVFGGPKYLKLVMKTTGSSDNRIVSLEWSNTIGLFPGPAQIQ